MYVVDASVWVSRFVPDDANYRPSYDWLSAQIDSNEVVASPTILLAEVGGAISRRTGDPSLGFEAVSSLQQLTNLRLEWVDGAFSDLSAQVAVSMRLRGADALYVALADSLGVPLITWDREQRERSGPMVSSLTPQEAL